MSYNPLCAFFRTLGCLLRGSLRFPPEHIGQTVTDAQEQTYTIFRQVTVDPGPDESREPGATFRVWFTPSRISARANRRFSWLTAPFIIGLPGFRAKAWLDDASVDVSTGACHGIYQWESVEAAERYAGSFAMRFMTRRSQPGSIHTTITQEPSADELSLSKESEK